MAASRKKTTATGASLSAQSRKVIKGGIKTGEQFALLMSALMTDLIEGTITPTVGVAVCNAGGKLLKVVELTHRYGTRQVPLRLTK